MWKRWLALNEEPAWTDVTKSVWAEHVEAVRVQQSRVVQTVIPEDERE